jgi:beta-lactam-binding protein with PASTA domain
MPDLVGITLREARTKIIVAGLRLGKLSYRYSIAKNVVLEQQFDGQIIEPGDTVLKGCAVDLVLGKGLSDEKSMVPNLIGLTMEQAIIKATDAFFTINTSIPDETVEESSEIVPFIYRHHPPYSPKVLVPLGTQITVWITTDSTKVADFIKKDSTNYIWEELHEHNDIENTEDDSYDYDNSD